MAKEWSDPAAKTREWAEGRMHTTLSDIHAANPEIFADPTSALAHPTVTAVIEHHATWLHATGARSKAESFVASLPRTE